jgi:hypothetical protein
MAGDRGFSVLAGMNRYPGILVFALLGIAALAGEVRRAYEFGHGLDQWAVEQQPGGTVVARDGVLVIDDAAGCAVWFKPKLTSPVTIRYEARVLSSGRVSDLNCFWMASDPAHADLLAPGHKRDGKFATYDGLLTYYVGYGGNANTTTRFRRYDGTGARPLLPEHDRQAPEFLLKADHWYRIELVASADGKVQFIRDGEAIFNFKDPAPLRGGWFGFRTVHSRIEIRNFSVSSPD